MNRWAKVSHDGDLAVAILDRVLERGRLIRLDGPSGRTRHLNLEDDLLDSPEHDRISGIRTPEFPEPTVAWGLATILVLSDFGLRRGVAEGSMLKYWIPPFYGKPTLCQSSTALIQSAGIVLGVAPPLQFAFPVMYISQVVSYLEP